MKHKIQRVKHENEKKKVLENGGKGEGRWGEERS